MMNELINLDEDFNEAMFKTKTDNVFVKILTSIMLDDLDSVKHFMNDSVYNKYKDYLAKLNANGCRQMYDELNVKSTEIIDAKVTDDKFIITVLITARYMDYLISKNTGDFISGENTRRIERKYNLVFEKDRDTEKQKLSRKCPGCGNNMDINNSGKCNYCGRIYDLDKYDYILTSMNIYE